MADPTTIPTAPVSLGDAGAAWAREPEAPAPARNEDGTFAAVTPTPTPDAPPASPDPATSEPQPPAAVDDPISYIEAKVGEETVKLRPDTLIPMKRNGQVTYEPLEKVQREGLLKADYDAKMVERKAAERALHARQVELEHRAARFEAEEQRLREAQADPEKWEQYQQHLQLMATNTQYRATFERAQRVEDFEARDAATRAVQEQAVIEDAVQTATTWITEIVGRHPGVSMERVRESYGRALAAGQARFDPADIERIVAQEAAVVAATITPLQQQVEALKAKLAAIEAAQLTNGNTTHALARAGTVVTAPIGGAPPVPGRRDVLPPTDPKARDLQARGAAWAKGA